LENKKRKNIKNQINDIIFVTNDVDMENYKDMNNDCANDNIANEPSMTYLRSPISNTADMINFARQGINMKYLIGLTEKLALNLQEMGEILHVSLRTLQRYAPTKILDTDASSKILNLAALQSHGIEVFGSEKEFNIWLKSEVPSLENKTPLSYLDTPFGFQLIDQTLGRIEHGIFA
jgi:putative toxin-antitoxin system antitoxin component (TIGR02293 family)